MFKFKSTVNFNVHNICLRLILSGPFDLFKTVETVERIFFQLNRIAHNLAVNLLFHLPQA